MTTSNGILILAIITYQGLSLFSQGKVLVPK